MNNFTLVNDLTLKFDTRLSNKDLQTPTRLFHTVFFFSESRAQYGNHGKTCFLHVLLVVCSFSHSETCIGSLIMYRIEVNEMVRLSVEQRARAVGLVEGGTSFTQLRLKSTQ